MREPSLSAASFPTAHCEGCGKSVLTYIGLDGDGQERRFCVHCDVVADSAPRWLSADELEEQGYYFGSEPPKSAGGGCSSGCGTCSTRKN
jgi:hypothetical protein